MFSRPLTNDTSEWLLPGLLMLGAVTLVDLVTPYAASGVLYVLPELVASRSYRGRLALLIASLSLLMLWACFAAAGAPAAELEGRLASSLVIVALGLSEWFRRSAARQLLAPRDSLLRYGSGLLDRVIDGMREGLSVRDAQGRLMFGNAVTRKFTGPGMAHDGSDMSGEGVLLLDPATGNALPIDELPSRIALRGLEVQDREVLLSSPHLEKPLPISVSAQPLFDETGAVEGCITWFRDISAQFEAEAGRRESEMKLRQAQKMEAVGQLAGGIAHDFNNLLTVMVGNSEMLLEELDPSQHDLRQLAEQIAMAAGRGADLTHRLLAFSRRQPLKPTVVNVNKLVWGMMPLLRRAIDETVKIEESLDADVGTALVDMSNLENALLNLTVNARDAMPGGGRLGITTRNAVIGGRDDAMAGEYVLLSVSDTGTGMSDEVKARAFEPFFTTKEAGKGTGLGLATIYGFVKQSGGFVDIDTAPGAGTTITLGLPRVHVSGASETKAVSPLTQKGRGQRILVVEDDDSVRNTLVHLLGDLGYKALSAADAETCLDMVAADWAIDLLITDVVMPSMNGWDLAKAVKDIRPGLPVLFTSGYTDNVLLQQLGLDERIRLLPKPFKTQDLTRTIEELLALDEASSASGVAIVVTPNPQARL